MKNKGRINLFALRPLHQKPQVTKKGVADYKEKAGRTCEAGQSFNKIERTAEENED